MKTYALDALGNPLRGNGTNGKPPAAELYKGEGYEPALSPSHQSIGRRRARAGQFTARTTTRPRRRTRRACGGSVTLARPRHKPPIWRSEGFCCSYAPFRRQKHLLHRPCSSVASASALARGAQRGGADAGAMEWNGRQRRVLPPLRSQLWSRG